jgi:hypothetical protein
MVNGQPCMTFVGAETTKEVCCAVVIMAELPLKAGEPDTAVTTWVVPGTKDVVRVV